MTNVELYLEAVEIAKAKIGTTTQTDFESTVWARAKELDLTLPQYQAFSNDARYIYGRMTQLAQQDAQAAKQAAPK